MAISKKKDSPYYYTRFAICGIRVQESTKCVEKREAQQYEEKRRNEIRQQAMLGKQPDRTWRDAALRWLAEKKDKKSITSDISHLEWLQPHLNQCQLKDITKDLIESIAKIKENDQYGQKDKKGVIKNKRDITPATVNRMLALIKSVLNRASHEWEWLNKVPVIRMRTEAKRRIRWITHDEANALIKELPEHLALMTRFSLATGLRAANVRDLLWADIDMKKHHAWVHHDKAKGEKAIAIPLNADAMAVLEKQQGKHPEYVFVYAGNPINQNNTKAWHKALKRAGIKNFRWHDLRHTWASWHVQSGTTLQELYELGGWASFDMVLKYAHLSSSHLRDAANRISGAKHASVDKMP